MQQSTYSRMYSSRKQPSGLQHKLLDNKDGLLIGTWQERLAGTPVNYYHCYGRLHGLNHMNAQKESAMPDLRNSLAIALPMPLPPPVMTTFSWVSGARQNLRIPALFNAAYKPPTVAPMVAGIQHGEDSIPASSEHHCWYVILRSSTTFLLRATL